MRNKRFFLYATSVIFASSLITACAKRPAAPVPSPEATTTRAPDLSSLTVMILPAQAPASSRLRVNPGEPVPGLDSEIGFFVQEQAPRVHWIMSDVVKKTAERTRAIHVDATALNVSAFLTMKMTRIGDPLWGDLHSLGEVMNARYALLPFIAGFEPDSTGTDGRVQIGAAIIDTGTGNVLWTGYAAGEHGPQNAPAVVASAARALARKIAP